jgi:hypothetical protein
VTVQVVFVVVHRRPPGFAVTVYPVIRLPPFSTGAIHATTDCALAFDEAVTAVGAPGLSAGIAAADETEATEVPLMFVAVTLKV